MALTSLAHVGRRSFATPDADGDDGVESCVDHGSRGGHLSHTVLARHWMDGSRRHRERAPGLSLLFGDAD
ncbi:MAG TPA: hypothetical protein QGF58_00330 [Myxococcota bacterium]|nr:hypothetical protein [Myxococcota bacterium]